MAQQFTLPDGRNLDYLISGDAAGFPFVFIHGTPGACPIMFSLEAAGKQRGVKFITLSRPGYGGSTRHKGRRVVSTVDDIHALLKHLGISKCIVAGWSGGGPLSLACAARLPGCVAALCVAGVAPYDSEGLDFLAGLGQDNIEEFGAAIKGEEELTKFCSAQRVGLINVEPEGLTEAMSSLLPDVDKKAVVGSEMGETMSAMFKEGLKTNVDGWVDDDLEMLKPWGFDLSEVKVPVFLYQGTEDLMVPFAHGKWLSEHLPQNLVQKHLMDGEGHISIFLGQMDKMIDDLMQYAK